MPTLNSHFNRNVSSVWYLIVVFLVAVGGLTWKAYLAIQEIDLNTQAIAAQLVEDPIEDGMR